MSKAHSNQWQRVSSTEIQRNFGQFLDHSLREPVLITKHDRDTYVLISMDAFKEYQKLKNGLRMSLHISELSDDDFEAIMNAKVPPEHDPDKKR